MSFLCFLSYDSIGVKTMIGIAILLCLCYNVLMDIRKPFIAATLAAGLIAGSALNEAPIAHADAARICVDVNGGTIGSEDGLPILAIQEAVGTYQDGKFGAATCTAVWNTLITEGHIKGDGTTLKIGTKVIKWLHIENTELAPAISPEATPTTPVSTSTANGCKYTVTAGSSQNKIEKDTGYTVTVLANELGKSKNYITMSGAILDTCINGKNDLKTTVSDVTSNPDASTAEAINCEAKGNYPAEVIALGTYSVEAPTVNASNKDLKIVIDKSKHTVNARLTLYGLVDYDYNSITKECIKDDKDSGNHDIVYTGKVATNPTHTPEGTFSIGAPYNTTCYNDKCVLKDFKSLAGKDELTGKYLNGNIGMHEIPRDVPTGMPVQDAIRNIDQLPTIHTEADLVNRQSSACIRTEKRFNKLVNRFFSRAKITITA